MQEGVGHRFACMPYASAEFALSRERLQKCAPQFCVHDRTCTILQFCTMVACRQVRSLAKAHRPSGKDTQTPRLRPPRADSPRAALKRPPGALDTMKRSTLKQVVAARRWSTVHHVRTALLWCSVLLPLLCLVGAASPRSRGPSCGAPPSALNASTPNVLIVGDSISLGYGSSPTDTAFG